MKKLFLLLCVLMLPSLPAAAGGAETKYEAWKFGRPGGYREKLKAPGRWFVRADSTSSSTPDFAAAMALHRAAIRMKSEGFDYFTIVNFEINNRQFCKGCSYGNQDVYLTVVGLKDSTKPAPCEAKPRFAGNCQTLSVTEALAKHGPTLGQTLDLQENEIARLQAK